ncbi:MAG: hypothetical protein ACRBFS_24110 [Aureispira sp.]
MATTTKTAFDVTTTAPTAAKKTVKTSFFQQRLNHYLNYAEKQNHNRLVWYAKTLLVLPCGFMVPLVIAMLHLTEHAHTFYIGLLILLLFTNVVAHVAQVSGRIFVPLYHATIAVMLIIPLVTYLLS